MDHNDQGFFSIPNGNHVNFEDVDWSMPRAPNNSRRNGRARLTVPDQTPDIEQLMHDMTLNHNSGFASASSSSSSSASRINNGATIGRSTLPNWETSDQSFYHFPQPCSDNMNINYPNSRIQYGLSHDYSPYYPTQNPNPNSSLVARRYRHLNNGPTVASSSRQQERMLTTDMILDMATEQALCCLLQDDLESREFPGIDGPMSAAVRPELGNMALQPSGNYFDQKLTEVTEEEELIGFVVALRNHGLIDICTDDNGNKVMLKLVDRLRWSKKAQMVLMEGLSEKAVELTKSSNCKQLIDNCFELFAREPKELLLNEIANHCTDIAKDKSGCCILQKCFRQDNIHIFHRLVESVTKNASDLSKDPFGNYIVQFVIELEVVGVAKAIAARLKHSFAELSMNIHSSNVVEKLMNSSSDPDVAFDIIDELMERPYRLLEVFQDQYGNFVAQTALKVSKSNRFVVYRSLKRFIEENAGQLKNHPHGRNVLRAIKDGKNIARRTQYNRPQ